MSSTVTYAAKGSIATTPLDRGLTWLAIVGRVIVAGLFLLAAVMKLLSPEEFAKDIRYYEVIPKEWSNAVAMVVPWFEITTAVLLVAGIWRKEAQIWIALMLIGFTALKFGLVFRGKTLECGCFGHGNVISDALKTAFSGWRGLALNFVMLAGIGLDYWVERRRAANRRARLAGPAAASPSK